MDGSTGQRYHTTNFMEEDSALPRNAKKELEDIGLDCHKNTQKHYVFCDASASAFARCYRHYDRKNDHKQQSNNFEESDGSAILMEERVLGKVKRTRNGPSVV
mmetsp:Transcript_117942/g.231479  ORF Transcript_117942/g.231479 Transcript_117942/m.231479 type:complete len:103 (-) Transcript_117942:207-515(-)